MRPSSFRSSHVVYANATITRFTITADLITLIHQASCTGAHLDIGVQPLRVAARDADCAGAEVARDAGAKLARGAVRADGDGVARADPAGAGVAARELDLAVAALELELGRAVDRRPGEERPVRDDSERVAGRSLWNRVGRLGRGAGLRCAGRELGGLADVAVGDAAVAHRRHFLEGGRGIRRDLDAEALAEARDPRQLVRARREDRAALALQAAFEVA